jgi:hypothetical protein
MLIHLFVEGTRCRQGKREIERESERANRAFEAAFIIIKRLKPPWKAKGTQT